MVSVSGIVMMVVFGMFRLGMMFVMFMNSIMKKIVVRIGRKWLLFLWLSRLCVMLLWMKFRFIFMMFWNWLGMIFMCCVLSYRRRMIVIIERNWISWIWVIGSGLMWKRIGGKNLLIEGLWNLLLEVSWGVRVVVRLNSVGFSFGVLV